MLIESFKITYANLLVFLTAQFRSHLETYYICSPTLCGLYILCLLQDGQQTLPFWQPFSTNNRGTQRPFSGKWGLRTDICQKTVVGCRCNKLHRVWSRDPTQVMHQKQTHILKFTRQPSYKNTRIQLSSKSAGEQPIIGPLFYFFSAKSETFTCKAKGKIRGTRALTEALTGE